LTRVLLADAKTAIESAPGPTPWFTHPVPRGTETLQWRHFNKDALAGIAMLEDGGKTFAVCDFQCYLQAFSDERWLIWYRTGSEDMPNTLRVSMFDPTQIAAIKNPLQVATQMRVRKERIAIDGEPLASFDVPCDLAAGGHCILMDEAFKVVPELLTYSRSTALGPRRSGGDSILLQIEPQRNGVTVHPQRWFNEGPHDFGYQWPCIVTREPKSQIIVGYGIRLGTYAYVNSLEDVVWFNRDPFAGWAS